MRKIFIIAIILMLIFNFNISYAEEDLGQDIEIENILTDVKEVFKNNLDEPNISCKAACVIDRETKAVLYNKNMNEQRAQASTTKIMTIIIAVEKGNLNDIVIASSKAANTGGTSLDLTTGAKVTLRDLLYGLMFISGNDAAVAIAEHIGGSVEGFAEMMNEKARELECANTNFVTPHGLDEEGHYTTAYELAIVSDYALKNKTIMSIAKIKKVTITINGYSKELMNTNPLLGRVNGVDGLKTGFTSEAMLCVVTSVTRGDTSIVVVILGADNRTLRNKDDIALIEYAFSKYEKVDLDKVLKDEFNYWLDINQKRISINKGMRTNLEFELEKINIGKYPIKKDEVKDIELVTHVLTNIDAPVEKGEVVRTM